MIYTNQYEDTLRIELLEAILAYFEGVKTYRSILTLGITAHSRSRQLRDQNITTVVSQLNTMGNQLAEGRKLSREEIKETFTTMLETLTKR